jgi:hypothetical protein
MAAVGILGAGALYYLFKPKTQPLAVGPAPLPILQDAPPAPPAPPPQPIVPGQAKDYDSGRAVAVILAPNGGSLTVSPGTSVRAENQTGSQIWVAPGVTTANANVLAPSDPGTSNGFVAAGLGTTTLTGYVWDQNASKNVAITASVTVAQPRLS